MPPTRRDVIRLVTAFAVVVAVTSALGLLLTRTGGGEALVRADERAVDDLVAARTAWLDTATGWATWLSDTVPVALAWAALVAFTAWRWRWWVPPTAVMVAVGLEKLSYLVTTIVVDRPRPDVEALGQIHATTSFPSGHAASAVSLYGVAVLLAVWSGHLRRGWRRAAAVGAVAVVSAVVAFGRVYRGHHHPSDVVAGVALGAVWLVLAWRLVLAPHPAASAPASTAEAGRPAAEVRAGR